LEVEALESRLTPIIAVLVGFRPTALVAVNPSPCPPATEVLFEPQLVLRELTPDPTIQGPATEPVHIEGTLTQVEADPIYMQMTFKLDGQIAWGVGGGMSANANFSVSGTEAMELFLPGSTTPLESKNATVTVTGSASLTVQTPTPPMGQELKIDMKYAMVTVTTGEDQYHQAGLGQKEWQDVSMVVSAGSGSDLLHTAAPTRPFGPVGEITGWFARQDQIHAVLTPVMPPSTLPPQPCIVDGVFMGTESMDEQLAPPGSPAVPPGGAELSGSVQQMGTLTYTITLPPPSPTAPPTMETMTIDIESLGTFDEVLMNPMP
jgi:hypothetical protein